MDFPAGFVSASIAFRDTGLARHMAVTCGFDLRESLNVSGAPNLIMQNIEASLQALLDSSFTVGPCTLRGGTSVDPTVAVSDPDHDFSGSLPKTGPPPSVCVLVHKVGEKAGRRNQGRFFWPALLAATDVDESGNIISAKQQALTTAFANLLTGLQEAAVIPCILHRPGVSSTPAPTTIVGFRIDNLIGSQRRRLGR